MSTSSAPNTERTAAGEHADDAAPPFFIVGNDRSGTTMLRVVLDRSPELAIPTESMFVADFARAGRELAAQPLPSERTVRRLAQRVWKHPKVRLWQLEGAPPAVPRGLSGEAAFRYVIEAPYKAYAGRDGKPRWGDKTPAYLGSIDELVKIWPRARFIVLVRDGRDVALSIAPLPFGANNAWSAARDWAAGIDAGRAAAAAYPDQVLEVRYEDLVADPARHVRTICEFLGVHFDPAMLRVEEMPDDKLEADKVEWFGRLRDGINQRSVGKWRTQMSARNVAVFEAVAGAQLAACGYELADEGVVASPDARANDGRFARMRRADQAQRLVNFVRLRVVQEHGRELVYVLRRKANLL